MHSSEKVDGILPALAAAIADMANPKKNAANPHFRNKFADLGEVLDCVKGPLHENGLLLTQHVHPESPDGEASLTTRVWHCKTGQWLESVVPLICDKKTAQGQGSAITYARRYALKALFAMHDEDDDGNRASGVRQQPAAKPASAPRKDVNAFAVVEEALEASKAIANDAQLREWGVRVKVSGFKGSDRDQAAAAYEAAQERIAIKAEA